MDGADYMLRCVRYIDLNPVRARMIDDPARYPWSSCAALWGEGDDPLLTLHPSQQALGANTRERGLAYRELLAECMNDDELAAIRVYLQQQRAWGRDEFQATVQAKQNGLRAYDQRTGPLAPNLPGDK